MILSRPQLLFSTTACARTLQAKTLRKASLMDGLITLQIRQGDLLSETTEGIVNPANPRLEHEDGLAGHIVRQGGMVIQQESDIALSKQPVRQINVGNAIATGAGSLPYKKIIHAVGPVWEKDGEAKVAQLKSAITNSLELAGVLGLKSLAIPAFSSGVYGFP